jgi:hypothetical protein
MNGEFLARGCRQQAPHCRLSDRVQRRVMSLDHLSNFESLLVGRRCVIERREADWALNLEGGGSISLPVPWRVVANGRIAFADEDDGQKFGLPGPLDGEALVNRLLGGRPIARAEVDRQTADLALHFGSAIRLDVFNYSAGYEGWHAILPPDAGGTWVIALGGGEIAIHA